MKRSWHIPLVRSARHHSSFRKLFQGHLRIWINFSVCGGVPFVASAEPGCIWRNWTDERSRT